MQNIEQQDQEQSIPEQGKEETPDQLKQKAKEYSIPEENIDPGFQVPTETIELPSKGWFYSNGKNKVEVKYPTASEDDILYSEELLKSGKVFDVLLQHCIMDNDINPDDLLTGDRDYILVQLSKNGVSEEYRPGPMKDPSTGEMWEPVIDLKKLKPKFIENKPDENGEFNFHLPLMKVDIKFRMLRGSDENKIAKKVNAQNNSKVHSQVKSGSNSPQYSKSITERYKLQIMEVNEIRDKLQVQKLVEAMPMKDSRMFREYIRNISPGIDLTYVFETPSGYTYEDEVPLNHRLFYPDVDIG